MTALARPQGRPAQFVASDQRRRSLIAKVHVARKELRLAEDDYRAVLIRVTGHDSAKLCTNAELTAVVEKFARQGFTAKASGKPAQADHPSARKARALWISLHQLGAIDNPSEHALEAFAKRQLGVTKLAWANQSLAYRLIEGLKAMAERAGWSQDLEGVRPEATMIVLKRRLVETLIGKLWTAGLVPATMSVDRAAYVLAGIELDSLMFATASELDLVAGAFGKVLRDPSKSERIL